jgi:hypothetical protein
VGTNAEHLIGYITPGFAVIVNDPPANPESNAGNTLTEVLDDGAKNALIVAVNPVVAGILKVYLKVSGILFSYL